MARIRNIKPEFFDDEGLGALTPLARLCFIGLWTQADKAGRLEDRPLRLKARLFPFDSTADVTAFIDELCAEGCVRRYQVKGQKLLWIPKFAEHQYLSKREPASTLPGPDESDTSPVPVLDESEAGTTDIGHRTRDKGHRTGDMSAADAAPAFVAAWNLETSHPIAQCRELTAKRRKAILVRLRDRPMAEWVAVFRRIGASDFCRGLNGGNRQWVASIDWVLQPDTAAKVLEGKYDNRAGPMMGAGKTAGNVAALQAVLSRDRGDDAVDRSGEGPFLQAAHGVGRDTR